MAIPDRFSAAGVQACRDDIERQIRAYRDLVGAACKASGMSLTRIDAALAAFEPAFFNNLLIALDARFAPGSRAIDEPGDFTPLDEVALLARALMDHGGVLVPGAAPGYQPSRAILGIDIGDRIALNADDFEALSSAFLAGIERRFAG